MFNNTLNEGRARDNFGTRRLRDLFALSVKTEESIVTANAEQSVRRNYTLSGSGSCVLFRKRLFRNISARLLSFFSVFLFDGLSFTVNIATAIVKRFTHAERHCMIPSSPENAVFRQLSCVIFDIFDNVIASAACWFGCNIINKYQAFLSIYTYKYHYPYFRPFLWPHSF